MTGTQVKNPMGWLAAIVAIAALLRLAAFSGYQGGDDRLYIQHAFELSQGRLIPDTFSHWQSRLGMLLPLAGLMRIFGASLAVVAAIPFFWTLVTVVLGYVAGQIFYRNTRTSLLAALLVAVFPLDVIFATQYFPDMALAALTGIAFLAFCTAPTAVSPSVNYALSGVALGLAYLHRETALFLLLPMFAITFVRRRWEFRSVWFALGLASVISAELLVFACMFHDPWHRVRTVLNEGQFADHPDPLVVASKPNDNEESASKDLTGSNADGTKSAMRRTEAISPARRIYRPLLCLMGNQEFGLFFFATVLAAFSLVLRRDRPSIEPMLWLILVGGYTLWGTVRLSGWEPLYTWPRYMSMVTIPALVLLARWLSLWQNSVWRNAAVGILVGTSLVCVYVDNTRTHRSLGNQLAEFWLAHRDRDLELICAGHAYSDLFVANGFRPIERVSLLGIARNRGSLRFDPTLEIHPDRTSLPPACYVVIPIEKSDRVPSEWKLTETVLRARRWFVPALEWIGPSGRKLGERLSPIEGYNVFLVAATE